MRPIKAVSLNCYGVPYSLSRKTRFKLIAQEIKKLDPDFIAFQEVVLGGDRKVLDRLASKGYSFFPKKHVFRGNGSLLTLTKFPIIFESFIPFTDQGPLLPLSLAQRLVTKGFHVIVVRCRGKPLTFINAHLLANFHNLDSEIRSIQNQMEQILGYINAQPKNMRFVICGDFNFPSQSPLYRAFVSKAELVDAIEKDAKTFSNKNPHRRLAIRLIDRGWSKHAKRGIRLDYAFVKGIGKRSVKQEVVFDVPVFSRDKHHHLSDHFGLLTTILLK